MPRRTSCHVPEDQAASRWLLADHNEGSQYCRCWGLQMNTAKPGSGSRLRLLRDRHPGLALLQLRTKPIGVALPAGPAPGEAEREVGKGCAAAIDRPAQKRVCAVNLLDAG